MKTDKHAVADYWERNINQVKFLKTAEFGSKEFFEEADTIRYQYHSYLPALFDRIARLYPNGKLLEVGCSMANDLAQMAKRGFQVTGIDLTEAGIDLARKHFALLGLRADLRVADAERLPFDNDCFDVVYSFGVLHHTPDTKKSVAEVYRVLKPGGMAVVMLYHTASLNYFAHRILGIPADGTRSDPVPVARTYTRLGAKRLFRQFPDVKLEVEYLFGTGWGRVNRLVPKSLHRFLGKRIGWHLLIFARK